MDITDLNEHFSKILAEMKQEYSETTINLWFNKSRVADFDGRTITISCENDFKRDNAILHYQERLKRRFAEATGGDFNISIVSQRDISAEESNIFSKAQAPYTVTKAEDYPEHREELVMGAGYTFDNFVVGSSNQVAQSACRAVAERPAFNINPLFLYGPSGLGKTHLLFAIENYLRINRPRMKVSYVTGEQFTNELIDAISKKNTASFRDKYRNLDILLVDDIQFIAGKMTIQEEFFHTFDTLYKLQKQIVLTSDRTPKDIDLLEDRLRTRFEMGLIVDIQPPETELRTAIFKQKTQSLGLDLPNDVLVFLAENIRSNVRQIEGAVKKLWAQSFITNEKITLEMAKTVLADYFSEERKKITPETILALLQKRYGILIEDMTGKRRSADIVYVRHLAIYLILVYTGLSLKQTGRIFDRDHTTIISARNGVEERIKNDASFAKELQEIRAELETK